MIFKLTNYFAILFIFVLPIPFLYSQELSIQDLPTLDAPINLNGNESSYWYAINRDARGFDYLDAIQNKDKFLLEWKPYFPPMNSYKGQPEWEGSKFLTYIKFVRIPREVKYPHYSIRLGTITDKDEVYINGKLIGNHGDLNSSLPEGYDKVRVYKIPTSVLQLGEINTILVLNKPYFPHSAGIEQDKILIGPSEAIEGNFLRDEFIKLLLLMVYLTVAMYFLFLFVRRRKDLENLFFGLFTISLVLYQFLRNQLKYDLDIDFLLLKKTEYLVLMTLFPIVYHFIRSYFKFKYHWIFKIADTILMLVFLYILSNNNVVQYDFLNRNIVQPVWIFYIVGCVYFLISKSIKKDLDSILMLIGFLFLISATILDILSTRNLIIFPRVAGYAFITLILSIATILANKFVRLNSQVEELNSNLEKKVEKRTEELNNSLAEIKILKVQQDGDYFLTYLLLNPLITNNSKSNYVIVDFFTKQKKSFEFKGKHYEIGGDISISSNIELRGKRYIVFINGDAMGKSMQGAGGALVLGVVFNAVLTRSNAEFNKAKHPEIWIKEAFIDLQRVFESFNGSMLISVVLGLIEEDSGLLYYINAEHPWTVLYRDDKASFLENELVLRKLGFPGNEEFFFVKTFLLKPGDVLIAGSDGRDDILLGMDQKGNRIINEDEEVFLGVVEEGHSNLKQIVAILESRGDYTDDITLLRIEYKGTMDVSFNNTTKSKPIYDKAKELAISGSYMEAVNLLEKSIRDEPHQLESTTLLLAQSYFKLKNWEKSLKYFEQYVNDNSTSIDNLFYASYSAKMSKKFEKSKEFGERCFLRNPGHNKNLINLADVYKSLGQKDRAMYLINRALKDEPNNRNAIRLKDLLDTEV